MIGTTVPAFGARHAGRVVHGCVVASAARHADRVVHGCVVASAARHADRAQRRGAAAGRAPRLGPAVAR